LNETKLKDLFVSSLESGRILNNNGDSMSLVNPGDEIRIKNEAYFGQFDLVIAVLSRTKKQSEFGGANEFYNNLLMRTGQLMEFAKSEKCSIDSISFYPVELKSNSDTLDARLPNQIINAILTFGRSIVVLDEKHVNKRSLRFLRLLPATIVGYTGRENYFRVLSVFVRFVNDGMLNLPKRSFVNILHDNGILEDADRLYHRLSKLERINQKIVFNQLYDSRLGFLKGEIEFLREFSKIKSRMSCINEAKSIVNVSKNLKVTDYL
jgi:hypothetical protein